MSEDDMKCMKAPTVEIRVERRYVVRVAGKELKSRFTQTGEMCSMKQLTDERGLNLVVDTPADFTDILNAILGSDDEYVKVPMIKASAQIVAEIKEVIDRAKADGEPVRQPVSIDNMTEDKSEDIVNKSPVTSPPAKQSRGNGDKE